jgi:hypothetical protein
MSQIKIKSSQFNVNNVSFNLKVDKETKRKVVYVNHNKTKILMQTPKVYLPNGIKHWSSSAYPESYEMEISFGEDKDNEVNNRAIRDFEHKMKELDSCIKNEILNNSKDWIGKPKTTMSMIEEAFYPNPIVRVPKDKDGNVLEYPNRIRLRLEREREGDNFTGRFSSSKKDRTQVLMFDHNNVQLDFNEANCESVVPKNSKAIIVMELVNINIVGDKVYPKWKLVQAKVFRNTVSVTENIIDDDDDEEVLPEDLDDETPVKEVVKDTDSVEAVDDNEEEEEDDEEEDDEEEEAVVAPVVTKPAVKGRGKRGVAAN